MFRCACCDAVDVVVHEGASAALHTPYEQYYYNAEDTAVPQETQQSHATTTGIGKGTATTLETSTTTSNKIGGGTNQIRW